MLGKYIRVKPRLGEVTRHGRVAGKPICLPTSRADHSAARRSWGRVLVNGSENVGRYCGCSQPWSLSSAADSGTVKRRRLTCSVAVRSSFWMLSVWVSSVDATEEWPSRALTGVPPAVRIITAPHGEGMNWWRGTAANASDQTEGQFSAGGQTVTQPPVQRSDVAHFSSWSCLGQIRRRAGRRRLSGVTRCTI